MANSKITTTVEGRIMTAEQFHAEARRWAAIVRNVAKANTAKFKKGKESESRTYRSGKKAGKSEKKLSKSTRFIIEHENKIPESVGFLIPIHGIYREWAVGFGQPRVAGKFVTANSKIKRSMNDWIDEPIEKHKEKLFKIAIEYWGDEAVVNVFGGKKG
ncbi:hypothetical protein LJC53_04900 [Bacteroidales bacterium OttesenSCG-928-C03]|nr:hypothetical protein [Bacteroidales bacterium OttesenSCG-928-C03]MDL2326141.1 hypothetical protein [Bacteroidales bacterium OttesenSCG-928-A14]